MTCDRRRRNFVAGTRCRVAARLLRERALFDFAINAQDTGSLFVSDAQGKLAL